MSRDSRISKAEVEQRIARNLKEAIRKIGRIEQSDG
jgi:hypothetical protein